jgi:hypothetical protein
VCPYSIVKYRYTGSCFPGENIIFGIYKMNVTQKNLSRNNSAWVVGAAKTDGPPLGYRFTGTAVVKGKQLIFTPEKAERLI